MEPLDALRMLVVACKGLAAGKYSALQRKLIPFLKHTTKLQLPYTLTYPLPNAPAHTCGSAYNMSCEHTGYQPHCGHTTWPSSQSL